ncbi:DUF763 domain-containing protein [Pedobacter sp. NJ-S-72]
MKRSDTADLPLHYGHIPKWLAERMSRLGLAITEAIIAEYGSHYSKPCPQIYAVHDQRASFADDR